MATEKLYFIRRAAGEPWKRVSREEHARGVICIDGLAKHVSDGAAVAEVECRSPACDVCSSITVRSGTCWKCLNCGNSMGVA